MRTYFFGDIHGNEDALDACLEHIDELRVDQVYCLGDIVGWLPFGDRTLRRMRSLGLPTVAGNHDLLVAGTFTDHPGQLDRMQATAYNAGLLSMVEGAIDYLTSLPLLLESPDFVVVHHSPFHLPGAGKGPTIGCFNYLDETALAGCLEAWRTFPGRLVISGHDHVPAVYELPDTAASPCLQDVNIYRPSPGEPLTVPLNGNCRYWVKAGSVGGPYRDGIPMANGVLHDRSSQTVTLFQLPYPTERLRRALASHRFCRNLPTIQKYVALLERQSPNK